MTTPRCPDHIGGEHVFDEMGLCYGSTCRATDHQLLNDGQIIDMANKALPGWTRKDNDLAYIQVVRAAIAHVVRRPDVALLAAQLKRQHPDWTDEQCRTVAKLKNSP